MLYTIRKADSRDIPDIAELERECFSRPWSKSALNETFSVPATDFLCAESDGKTVAYISFCTICGETEIYNIAVTTGERRKGIGTALLKKAMEICRAKGAHMMRLEVRSQNSAAEGLYRSLGFKNVGIRKKYYGDPCDDAIIMQVDFED